MSAAANEPTPPDACALGERQHIQGWEIFALRQIVEEGHTPHGDDAVDTVRVVFLEKWMADSEKRPLLDIGCRVYVQAADGGVSEVTD